MTNRNDIHRATEDFKPEDYVAAGYYYTGEPPTRSAGYDNTGNAISEINPAYAPMVEWIAKIVAATSTAHHNGHQCDHCGAHIAYVVVVQHQPTGDYLAIGEQCADGRFTYSAREFARMHKRTAEARKAHKAHKAWAKYQEDHPTYWDVLYASPNRFVQDVLRRGQQYGSLSDRQFEAIVRSVITDPTRAAQRAAREAAEASEPKMTAPEGRVAVRGEVVATKMVEGQFGSTLKMLVKCFGSEGAFKVWSTVPASIDSIGKGDTVEFTATFTRASDDPFFAFGKRPNNGTVLVEAEA